MRERVIGGDGGDCIITLESQSTCIRSYHSIPNINVAVSPPIPVLTSESLVQPTSALEAPELAPQTPWLDVVLGLPHLPIPLSAFHIPHIPLLERAKRHGW